MTKKNELMTFFEINGVRLGEDLVAALLFLLQSCEYN